MNNNKGDGLWLQTLGHKKLKLGINLVCIEKINPFKIHDTVS